MPPDAHAPPLDHNPPESPEIPVRLVRSLRARRYLLRLDADGTARLVIPRRGSQAEALRFLERSRTWLERRHQRWLAQRIERHPWHDGATFLFRGELVPIRITDDLFGSTVTFAGEVLRQVGPAADYRAAIQKHLRALAECELPARTRELAREHGITIRRVTVRAQKTRWGSCSASGTISLNWRLIHAPPFVQDYLIIHELMHRRQMNHSARYWNLVAETFPRWREAEAWLKQTRLESLA
jgi:predicted metal-dependent hydrolase